MNYSICISTIYKSISKFDIHEFMEKNLGKVSRIDCVDLNQNNRRVFVHFLEWYSNKEFPAIVLHQLESEGFCNFYIPNKKNTKNPHFYAKILINKNPISHTDYKIKKMNIVIGDWVKTIHEQDQKIDLLEQTIQTMQLTIKYITDRNESLSELNKLYNDNDYFSSCMDISELN